MGRVVCHLLQVYLSLFTGPASQSGDLATPPALSQNVAEKRFLKVYAKAEASIRLLQHLISLKNNKKRKKKHGTTAQKIKCSNRSS